MCQRALLSNLLRYLQPKLSLGGFKRQGSFPSNLLASQTPILAQLKRFGLGSAVLLNTPCRNMDAVGDRGEERARLGGIVFVEAHRKLAGVRPTHNESRLEFVVQGVICQGDNISKLLPCVFLCAIDEREPLARVKGGSFRDLPLTTELSDSLEEWFAFLESVKGVRPRTGGIDFAGSALVFPGRDGAPFSNKAFNARLKLACQRARVPVISAHPLRHTAATLLLNERGANLRDVQALLGP